jgi:hypothetical protein
MAWINKEADRHEVEGFALPRRLSKVTNPVFRSNASRRARLVRAL